MKLDIEAVERSATDPTGHFVGLGMRSPSGDRYAMRMTVDTASMAIAHLAAAGLESAKVRGFPDGPPEGAEHLQGIPATFADASVGPDGQTLLVLRFGTVTVSTLLHPSTVRALSDQLQVLSVLGPATYP